MNGIFDQCFGTPASVMTLLLRGQTRSDQCIDTPASATTLLLHRQARSDQCFGTPTSATKLLLHGQARLSSVLYRTFGYLLCCVLLIRY